VVLRASDRTCSARGKKENEKEKKKGKKTVWRLECCGNCGEFDSCMQQWKKNSSVISRCWAFLSPANNKRVSIKRTLDTVAQRSNGQFDNSQINSMRHLLPNFLFDPVTLSGGCCVLAASGRLAEHARSI